MVEANAKTLRPLVKAAVKTALGSRGWEPIRSGRFAAKPEIVQPPLRALLDPDIVGDAYGGLRIGLSITLTDPIAEQEASTYGLDALPADPYLELGEWALAYTSAPMPDPTNRSYRHWLIVDTDDVQSTVDEWASVIDGPMHEWLILRNSEDQLLDTVAAAPDRIRRHPFATRLIALIALRTDRVDLARLLIAQYERGMDDTPDRIAEFERQLAAHHPEYGPLQRT
jgi:hypothetical protein